MVKISDSLSVEKEDGTITFVAGDTDFQSTLTQAEKDYIHEGCNWIGKLSREIDLKALHNYGKTLDEVKLLSEDEQKTIWSEAINKWNDGFNN